MAAIAFPYPSSTRPALRVVDRRDGARGGASPRNASTGAYRRRRLAVLTVVFVAVVLIRLAVGALGSGSLTAPGSASHPHARPAVVVRAGDTLWTVAARLGPNGDVRATVDRLVAANHSAELHVGDRIVLR